MKDYKIKCFIIGLLFLCVLPISAFQKKDTVVATAQLLSSKKLPKELLEYTQKAIQSIVVASAEDSLTVTKLYYYQSKANYDLEDNLASIVSSNQGILFAPKTNTGLEYKGRLLADRAWPESKLSQTKKAVKSLKDGIEILTGLPDKNPSVLDYIVNCYVLLSSELAYLGDVTAAKHNIRLAESIYRKNKLVLDAIKVDAAGNYHRYEIVLLYRKIYLLYSYAKNKKDSLELEHTMQALEKAHGSKLFNKNERIYYTTALNHVGDWYLSYKEDLLITKADIEKGSHYINKSIDLIENKGYPGNYFSFKYNKCKALTKSNNLNEANILIDHLLDSLPKSSGIRAFFLAQKGLIQAKLKKKENAIQTFHDVITRVHKGDEVLAQDYSNFKPSKKFNESRLIRRVTEKLELYFGDDPEVKKRVAQLYHIALLQFENSYGKAKFNSKENNLLRKILLGFLTAKKEGNGLDHIPLSDILSKSETIINRRTWQQFNQNRYTNSLSKLDSLTAIDLELRTALVIAKQKEKASAIDSIQSLMNQHETFTKKVYPKLDLLREHKFELSALQYKLADDELVLKYLLLENHLAIFSITSKELTWQLIPWTLKEQELVSDITSSIVNRKFTAEKSKLLSNVLIPSISKNIKKIIINPDGELYKIPFEVLTYNTSSLLNNFTVSYTSNLGFIHADNVLEKEEKKTFVYAPNYGEEVIPMATRGNNTALVGALKESEIISKLFPSEIYSGNNVSKEVFIETAPKASVLHLAMHAEVNQKESGLSRLIFGKDNNTHEDLYLEELYALNLNADLAVLSACNTGLGKENAGRSMESFERAFTFSGVSATVASLWEVPDIATSEIMEVFYQNLKKGKTKSEALANAKLNYISKNKDTKLAEPFYWAGFVLYGEHKALVTDTTNWLFWILGGLLLVGILIVIKRKNIL